MNKPKLFYFFTPNTYHSHLDEETWLKSVDGRFFSWLNSKLPSDKYLSCSICNSKKTSYININVLASEFTIEDVKNIDFTEFFSGCDIKESEYYESLYSDEFSSVYRAKEVAEIVNSKISKPYQVQYIKYVTVEFDIVGIRFRIKPKYNK